MIAEARIQTDALAQVLTVPVESVVRDPQGATLVYVYFPSQKRVFARRVELATFRGTEVEIRHGLAGNELIVVAGQQKLRDGTLVDVSEGTR